MEYFTSDSFKNWERIGEPFDKNGKLYTTVKEKCDRCVRGIYAIGVENGHLKPHPAFGGVCLKCGGLGWLKKDVRLYTEAEYNTMQKNNERARLKREQERNAKIETEFENNKKKWLLENGFNENEITYIYSGSDSYFIKEQLKEDGYKFNSILLWHKSTKDEKYINNLIEVNLNDIAEWNAWGQAHFTSEAKDFIDEKIAGTQPQVTSTWIAAVGDKIKDIKVQLIRKFSFESKYGLSNCYHFQTEEGNILVWFSSTFQPYKQGDWLKIKYATVKKHDTYKDVKQTILTRCKLVEC